MELDCLVQRAQHGDYEALDELCEREWKAVYAIAYRSLRDVSDAQDITQEVFLRALRSLARYRDLGTPFSAYLGTITRNLVRDRLRKQHLASVKLERASEIPSTLGVPEDQALRIVEWERLQHVLQSLSVDHRTVIQLCISDGRSAAEVAEIMGRSPAAVRQLQYRALSTLRTRLQENGYRI